MHARQHAWLPTKVHACMAADQGACMTMRYQGAASPALIKKEKDWGGRRFNGDLGRAQMEQEVGMTQSTDLGTGIGMDLVVQNTCKGPATIDTNLG
jgi:hypothetical protein